MTVLTTPATRELGSFSVTAILEKRAVEKRRKGGRKSNHPKEFISHTGNLSRLNSQLLKPKRLSLN